MVEHNVKEIMELINSLIITDNIYVVNKYDKFMDIRITGVEIDPDGDIKIVTEIID
jgi:hypothetical protein